MGGGGGTSYARQRFVSSYLRPFNLPIDPPHPLPRTAGIELNQGDTIGGTVNRADVAEIVVEAALSPATENTLFEVYGELSATAGCFSFRRIS